MARGWQAQRAAKYSSAAFVAVLVLYVAFRVASTGLGAIPVSAYPLMLDGAALSALVVGGGSVAARKASRARGAGARVHVVAPEIAPEIESLAPRQRPRSHHARAVCERRIIGDALLVIAATNDSAIERDRRGRRADARPARERRRARPAKETASRRRCTARATSSLR